MRWLWKIPNQTDFDFARAGAGDDCFLSGADARGRGRAGTGEVWISLLLVSRAVAKFLLVGGQLGLYKFVKTISPKINKTSLNFKILKKILKGFKVNFKYVAIKNFLFKTKIDLYYLKIFEKKSKINLEKIA